MSRIHLGRVFNVGVWYSKGLIYPLDRHEYQRCIYDWVFEDDITDEGIFIVSHRVTGELRYVVLYRYRVYRALIHATGEILECSSMKAVYRFAMRHVKDELRSNPDLLCCTVEFERGYYSDYEYLNSCGYMQRDFVDREHIAFVAVSETGYTVDCVTSGILDVKRG